MMLVVCGFVNNSASSQRQIQATDSLIFAVTGLVSSDSLLNIVQSIQDYGTRFMMAHNRKEAAANDRDLSMVINNDMIAWNDGPWTVSLINDPNSQRITDLAVHVIDTYTTLNRNFSWFGTYCDLNYFLYQGYEGIYLMENVSVYFFGHCLHMLNIGPEYNYVN